MTARSPLAAVTVAALHRMMAEQFGGSHGGGGRGATMVIPERRGVAAAARPVRLPASGPSSTRYPRLRPDGTPMIDAAGHVVSTGGGPIRFPTRAEAEDWIRGRRSRGR